MPSQKLPLFNGTPVAVPVTLDVDPRQPVTVFTPPDKALETGTQATYELHLWLMPGSKADGNAYADGEWILNVFQDAAPLAPGTLWSSTAIAELFPVAGGSSIPIKILDGYPVRGEMTLDFTVTTSAIGDVVSPPNGPQLFGYYYRVGQGSVIEPERRFIGEDLGDVDAGKPILLAAGTPTLIHQFSSDRIDEISLAINGALNTVDNGVVLRFADSAGVIVPGTGAPFFAATDPKPLNSLRDPQSAYVIKGVPFGGGALPTLDRIMATALAVCSVHGYFTRRGV